MSEHVNTEGERITIERRLKHGVEPVVCLVIHDDAWPRGTGQRAPMRLDAGTRVWLRGELDKLDREEAGNG